MGAVPQTVIVVPCYNERARLDADGMVALARGAGRVLLVDDGSTDGTRDLHRQICARSDLVSALALERNRGKAEAVRRGLLTAIGEGAGIVGYADADLATPVSELLRLLSLLEGRPGCEALLGSRVALAGRAIERDLRRHYAGRMFSTGASLVLGRVIYDTQCGAKFFRVTDRLRAALSEPFLSPWAFDVELLGRLIIGAPEVPGMADGALVEEPLFVWVHADGSKMTLVSMARTALEMGRIRADLRRRAEIIGRGRGDRGRGR